MGSRRARSGGRRGSFGRERRKDSARAAAPPVRAPDEEAYAALLDVLPDAVVIHGGGRILHANRAAVTMIGAESAGQLIGKNPLDFVDPDCRAIVSERVRRIQEEGWHAELVEERLVRLDGRVIDVETTAVPLRYQGEAALQAVIRDISSRKRTEEALRRGDERLRCLTAALPEVLWVIEPNAPEPWYASAAGEQVFGVPAEVLRRRPEITLEMIHPEDQPRVLPIMLGRFREPYDLEYRIVRPDARVRWLRTRSFPELDERGEVVRIAGFTEDCTDRREAEERLRQSEASLAEAQRLAQLGSWELDLRDAASAEDLARGRLDWSDEVFRIFGYEPGAFEPSAERFFASVHPQDRERIREATIASIRDCKPYSVEHRIVLPDGTLRVVHERSQVYRADPSGRPVRMIGTVQDVTERKRAEEELARVTAAALEASRLKSAFLANMSHEIRTPLNVMLGLSWVVREHLAEIGDHSQEEYFEGITRASRRLLATIHGILDLSKIESSGFEVRPTLVDLRQVIREQVAEFEPLATQKGITLRAEFDVGDAVVLFDEYCLQQALSNLLDNAVKFTARGGVCVRLRRDESGAPTMEVEDTGVGIDPGFLPRLWEPFVQEEEGYTRRFEGSGLGLTLVKKYLELNGAAIEARSEKGKGTRFRIRFAGSDATLGEPPASAASEPPRDAEGGGDRRTLLLVEDDEDTVFYLRRIVGARFRLLCASNGDEFRERLAAAEGDVDLIVMDLSLEGTEDGLDLTRWLRADGRFRHIPVLAVTAHAFEQDEENAMLAGCDDYLAKPVTPRELLAKISEVLRRRAPQRSTGAARI